MAWENPHLRFEHVKFETSCKPLGRQLEILMQRPKEILVITINLSVDRQYLSLEYG